MRNHLKPQLGTIRLQQLTMQLVLDFYADLRSAGNRRTRQSRGLSANSVWSVHQCLTRALNDAVKRRLLAESPARGAFGKPKDRPEIEFWTSEEFAIFLDWIDGQGDLQNMAVYRLAVQTGMRRGELLGLRWSDIDWRSGRLTVQQQITGLRQGAACVGPPKTRSSRRTIDLSGECIASLQNWREKQGEQRLTWAELYQDTGLVFCRENGDPHDPQTMARCFLSAVTKAKVKRIRFHDLRHTSAVDGTTAWAPSAEDRQR